MLLIWDSLEVAVSERFTDDDSADAEVWRALAAEGLIQHHLPPEELRPPKSLDQAAEEWLSVPWEVFPFDADPDLLNQLAGSAAEAVVQDKVSEVKRLVTDAAKRGLAPVAIDSFASNVAPLPSVDHEGPIAEGMLIQAASKGVRISPSSSLEDIFAFREKNRNLMGRFRASLIDLSVAVQAESPDAAAEQAHATVVNRIEPALSDLETALKGSRLRFAWNTMLGASAVVLGGPLSPAAVTAGAGNVVSRRLQYAFNRDRLVQDHPFGLLHQISTDFERISPNTNPPITDPVAEAQAGLQRKVEILIKSALETKPSGDPQDEAPGNADVEFNP